MSASVDAHALAASLQRLRDRTADAVLESSLQHVADACVELLGVPVGSLDVYRSAPHRWTDSTLDALVRFGEVVEAVITTAVHAERAGDLAARLSYALDHRNAVERATGYVMAREHVGRPAAFDRLRRTAQAQNRRIGDVATALLDTGRMPGDPL